MNGREMLTQTTNDSKPPNTSQATEQTDRQNCRQTLAAQVAKLQFKQQRQQCRLKDDYEISQTEYIRQRQISKKKF